MLWFRSTRNCATERSQFCHGSALHQPRKLRNWNNVKFCPRNSRMNWGCEDTVQSRNAAWSNKTQICWRAKSQLTEKARWIQVITGLIAIEMWRQPIIATHEIPHAVERRRSANVARSHTGKIYWHCEDRTLQTSALCWSANFHNFALFSQNKSTTLHNFHKHFCNSDIWKLAWWSFFSKW